MSFPPGTEMFQFPGFASPPYVFRWRYPKGVGCPIRISTDQSLLAAPRGFSQRATSFIASWCQGIHRMPLSRSRSHGTSPKAMSPPLTEAIFRTFVLRDQNYFHPQISNILSLPQQATHSAHNNRHLNAFPCCWSHPTQKQDRHPVRQTQHSTPRDAPKPDSP